MGYNFGVLFGVVVLRGLVVLFLIGRGGDVGKSSNSIGVRVVVFGFS